MTLTRATTGAEQATARRVVLDAARVALADPDGALRFLAALETAYAPTRQSARGRRGQLSPPYWRPPTPPAVELLRYPAGYVWTRPYDGLVTVLDRTGAWVAAAASVSVAHGQLHHAGAGEFRGAPGLYQVRVYHWYEHARLPSPLGALPVGDLVWVTADRVKLLAQLADAGRWADATVFDSYVGDESVRLREWASGYVGELRRHALTTYGRGSAQYGRVKQAFGQAVSVMDGRRDPGTRRRIYDSGCQRPDWAAAIRDLAAVTLWRTADACWQAVTDDEDGPVAVRATDELVVPVEALPAILRDPADPADRRPVRLDPVGLALGTYRVKGEPVDWPQAAEGSGG